VLRLKGVQISGQGLEMFGQLLIANDFGQLLIGGLERIALATQHESHLLQSGLVFAFFHDFANEVHLVHFLCHSQSIWVSLKLFVNAE